MNRLLIVTTLVIFTVPPYAHGQEPNAAILKAEAQKVWPAPGSEDTELGVFMGPEVSHGETKVYAGVQA
jgi:hypothetical protein